MSFPRRPLSTEPLPDPWVLQLLQEESVPTEVSARHLTEGPPPYSPQTPWTQQLLKSDPTDLAVTLVVRRLRRAFRDLEFSLDSVLALQSSRRRSVNAHNVEVDKSKVNAIAEAYSESRSDCLSPSQGVLRKPKRIRSKASAALGRREPSPVPQLAPVAVAAAALPPWSSLMFPLPDPQEIFQLPDTTPAADAELTDHEVQQLLDLADAAGL
jgi:hypothetical protein